MKKKKINLKGNDIYVYEAEDGIWAKVFEQKRRLTARKEILSASYEIKGNKVTIHIVASGYKNDYWQEPDRKLKFHFRSEQLIQTQQQIRSKISKAEKSGDWQTVDALKDFIEPSNYELERADKLAKKIQETMNWK